MNRIEAVGNYLGSVANRAIGREAWRETMREYKSNNFSFVGAGIEFIMPFASSRQIAGPLLRTRYIEKHPYAGFGILMALITTETALCAPTISIFLANSPWEAIGLKLATNAVVHMRLDTVSAVANRIRNHRPSGTTLAV